MIRLAVRCAPELAERALAELLVLAPNGVEEERGDGWVEYAVYGAPGELPDLGEVRAAAGDGLVEVTSTEVPEDWADRWRDFHEPVLVGGRVLVRPSWVERSAAPGRGAEDPAADPAAPGRGAEEAAGFDVIVDPGQAFGTGAHPTTRMCVELLLALADAGEAHGPLADLGTGSGVLAITAAKLGFSPVVACDRERAALDAAAANAAANGVEVDLRRVNLRDEPPPPAPTLVANLTAPLLREVAERLQPHSAPSHVVCSGLLDREADAASAAFAAAGLSEARRLHGGDWAALLLSSGGVRAGR